MRKRIGFLLVLALLIVSTVSAAPSMRGRRGILRVLSARTTPMAELCVNLHGEYAQGQYPDTVPVPLDNWHIYPKLHTGITYGVVDFLEFSVLGNWYCKYDQSDSLPDEYSIGLEDAELGIKFGAPIAEDPGRGLAWAQGIHLHTNITRPKPPYDDSVAIREGFKPYTPHSFDFGADLLTDLEVDPLDLRLNVGYFRAGEPKSGYELPDSLRRRDQARWGVGVQIAAGPYVKFLTEVMGKRLMDEDRFPPDTLWITPGIRFTTPQGVTFDFGCDFALTEDFDWVPDDSGGRDYRNQNANWNALVGITITSSLKKPPAAVPVAEIAGKVTDAETGEPLGAEISFPGTAYEAVKSNPETGLYKLSLKPGLLRVHVSKEGYLWKEKAVTLKDGRAEVLDFALSQKRIPTGTVTGKVTDAKTGKPMGAKITFPDTKLPVAASDMETGIYKVTLPPGTYTAKAEADGYDPESLPLVAKENETVFLNFKLQPKEEEKKLVIGERIILRGINFNSGSATIRPESYPILDDAARTLQANPTVRVEIQGHTDSVGSAEYNQRLSEARALSVRSYLIQVGIEAERLLARGYGESMPVASNATSAGRLENRRIEFLILSK